VARRPERTITINQDRIQRREKLRRRVPDAGKNALRPLVFRWRLMRPALRARRSLERMRPRFLVIGAMKAGTTAVFNHIASHPMFREPLLKEVNYFDFQSSRPFASYLAQFPPLRSEGGFTGEASTGYLWHPRCAERVRAALPGVKVIALLRDPVERALSHYFHARRVGDESRPLAEALRAPEADLDHVLTDAEELGWHRGYFGAPLARSRDKALVAAKPIHRSYVGQSRYADHIQPWLDRFDPSQLLFLNSESYFADPIAGSARLWQFLEVPDPGLAPSDLRFNEGRRADVPTAAYDFLRDALADATGRLAQTLGPEFVWSDARRI